MRVGALDRLFSCLVIMTATATTTSATTTAAAAAPAHALLHVPEAGLALCKQSTDAAEEKPAQVLRLNLSYDTLDELVHSLRSDQRARIRLGKSQTLYYGSGKSQHLHSLPEACRSELYCSRSDRDHDSIYLTGLLSHRLEVSKGTTAAAAATDTLATDQALATLEHSLQAIEQGKETKKTHIITDLDQVRGLKTGGKGGSGAGTPSRRAASRIDLEKDRLSRSHAVSLSASPMLRGAASPTMSLSAQNTPILGPAVAQSKDQIRLDALKVPLIHLLAVRAVSAKFLARQTHASQDDCLSLLAKYGVENRLDRDKYDLKDRTYRELDVWNFPYPSQHDRQDAIENAISAFDRMRISRSDQLWQALLPKNERGKGKVLSRLDLRAGPIKNTATPRIQIEEVGDTPVEGGSSSTSFSSSSSSSSSNKNHGETTRKRSRSRSPMLKKHSNNTTLTGRVTKKPEKSRQLSSKIKSAEFVNDSDEEDEVSSPRASPAAHDHHNENINNTNKHNANNTHNGHKTKAAQPDHGRRSPASSVHDVSKTASSKLSPVRHNHRHHHDVQASRGRSTSSSSSSSSPLMTQISKQRAANKATVSTQATTRQPSNNDHQPATPNKAKPTIPSKRSAEPVSQSRPSSAIRQQPNGTTDNKRRREASSSSAVSSDESGSGSSASSSAASTSLSRELLLQQLHEKARKFKHSYAKYRTLHDSLASLAHPPRVELEKLQKQHHLLLRMKKEIWDEDRRIRS